jgi:anti-sigma regulatory factor (Ser/Thr protein kinase)
VLLRQEVADGVEVLSVRGPVGDADAGPLVSAVRQALEGAPRAVVLDLAQAESLSDRAWSALHALPQPKGFGPGALVVCPPAGAEGGDSALDRRSAVAAFDRRAHPRTVIDVEHSVFGPAQARAAVNECAARLGLDEVCDDVVLLVSELVTNAVRYAEPPVRLELQPGDGEVVVAVRDGSPEPPAPRDADDDAEGGRGMMLVDLLAADHGVRTDPPGKAVWARLRRSRFGS